ncbi:MAG: L,D-transpeptidase family protein, partial [Sphingomicrobium sp.]
MTLRTLLRGASHALLIAAAPIALATTTPAAAADVSAVPSAAANPAATISSTALSVTPGAQALPAAFTAAAYPTHGRYLLVDAASAQLFMVEDGAVRDSMKVIVGKASAQTPTLASKIYYATLNPYWNVPADLAKSLIAPRVLEQGVRYLTDHNYQVLASFAADAPVISPKDVDWRAVADGRITVKVRQLPGPANSMGQVKFGFPNNDGIFLHDTPRKELFAADQRAISHGCVRLEDAPRLARWLMGRD